MSFYDRREIPHFETVQKMNKNHGADGRFSSAGVGAMHSKHFEADKKMNKESGYLPTAGVLAQRMEGHLRDEASTKLKAIRPDAYMDGDHFGFRDNRDVPSYNAAMERAGAEIPGAVVNNDGGRANGRFVPSDVQVSEAFNDHASYVDSIRAANTPMVPGSKESINAFDRANPGTTRPSTDGSTNYNRQGRALIDPASVGMGPRTPKVHATYADAHKSYMEGLRADGWDVKTHGAAGALKVPHATSPSGQTRLWFKTQSVYRTVDKNPLGAARHDMGKAHSITQMGDSRRVSYDDFKKFHKLPVKKP